MVWRAAGLDRMDALVQANHGLFSKKEEKTYTPEQKQTLLSTWGALFSF